jgi:hypothetical protein
MDAPSPSNERADPTRDVFESAAGIDVASNIADDVADISPKNRSLHPPFGPSSPSTTVASADGDISSPSSAWKSTLPETPRWRFVSRAKKTEGYSSSAAGTFVIGEWISFLAWGGFRIAGMADLSRVFLSAALSTIHNR